MVGTQIGFYRTKMRLQVVDFAPLPLPALDLAVFTPLATEGVVWMCTLMAIVLVILNRPAGVWTRSMWFFASIAAFVNAFRAGAVEHDLLGGVATGGLSIAGPYTVHLFVVWVRHLRTGRTLNEARVETEVRWSAIGRVVRTVALLILDHVVHPVTALRTIWVWRTYRGIRYSAAWFIASAPLRVRVRKQYGAQAIQPVQTPPETPVQTAPVEPSPEPPEDVPHGGVLTAVRADDEAVRDEVTSFLSYLNDTHGLQDDIEKWSEEARAQGVISGNTNARTHATDTGARTTDATKTPRAKRSRKAKRTGAKGRVMAVKNAPGTPSARDQIRAEYERRVNAGETTNPELVDFAALARDLNTSRTTVSRTWRECANRNPRSTP